MTARWTLIALIALLIAIPHIVVLAATALTLTSPAFIASIIFSAAVLTVWARWEARRSN